MSENEGTVDDGGVDVDGAADGSAAEAGADEPAERVTDDLVERVADSDPETVAEEIVGLRERASDAEDALAERDEEIADLESRLKRTQADFQNYKKRQEKRREEVRARATEDLVERLLEVRDNLDRALGQDADADIREGVQATFRLLDDILADEDVEAIEPGPGAETDPTRHEVLLTVESDQPEGTVAEVHRPGYEMAGKVLRPAQVTVADDGEAETGGGDAAGAGGEDRDGDGAADESGEDEDE